MSETPRITPNWEQTLVQKGLNFNIPPRFTDFSKFPITKEGTPLTIQQDELTKLPVENDNVRRFFVNELGQAIKDNKSFACLYVDADNLKVANSKYGRPMGDLVIRHGAAAITQALEKANLSEKAKIYVTRQTGAADENVVWMFDVNDEEMNRIKAAVEEAEKPVKIENPDITFSFTSTLIDTSHPEMKEFIDKAKSSIETFGNIQTHEMYDLYEAVKERADNEVKYLKIGKDLARLPIDDLLKAENIHKFINVIVSNVGGSRIGPELLEVICKLSSVQGALALRNSLANREGYKELLVQLGAQEERLKHAKDPLDFINIFQDMFGSIEETSPQPIVNATPLSRFGKLRQHVTDLFRNK